MPPWQIRVLSRRLCRAKRGGVGWGGVSAGCACACKKKRKTRDRAKKTLLKLESLRNQEASRQHHSYASATRQEINLSTSYMCVEDQSSQEAQHRIRTPSRNVRVGQGALVKGGESGRANMSAAGKYNKNSNTVEGIPSQRSQSRNVNTLSPRLTVGGFCIIGQFSQNAKKKKTTSNLTLLPNKTKHGVARHKRNRKRRAVYGVGTIPFNLRRLEKPLVAEHH